ncbi:MAG: IS1595 family transposase [Candidatus Hydromicrobium americanum]|nr:MAG: IS1595 family transposase [Candidatus Hydromicrobium americanum]
MEVYPRNLMEFEQQFASEEACREYLFQLRWPDGFQCHRCQNQKVWKTIQNLYYCANCGYKTSITAGTIFQDTSKPLLLWFRAMWYVTNQKHGVSALGLQRALGLGSYRTAWAWLHKLRCAMVRPGRDRLFGTVQVDETYIGGPEIGKRGRGAAGKALVVVAAQQDGKRIGRIRLQRVADASAECLNDAVMKSVKPNSIVQTDGWNGYKQLDKLGYTHDVIRQTSDIGENLLPLVNRVVSLLKRWLLGTHQGAVKISHLDYYLDEFTFRFNRRTSKSRGKLFYRLVQQSVEVPPTLIKDIAGDQSRK